MMQWFSGFKRKIMRNGLQMLPGYCALAIGCDDFKETFPDAQIC